MRREQSAEHIQRFLEAHVGEQVLARVFIRGKVSAQVVGILEKGVGRGRGRGDRDFDWAVRQPFDGVHAGTSVRFDAEWVHQIGSARIDLVF